MLNNFQIISGVFGAFSAVVAAIGWLRKDSVVLSFGIIVGVITIICATSDELPSLGIVSTKPRCYVPSIIAEGGRAAVVTNETLRANGCMVIERDVGPSGSTATW